MEFWTELWTSKKRLMGRRRGGGGWRVKGNDTNSPIQRI